MKTVFIYALNEPCSGPDPTAGRTRYIGKAIDPYERYEGHMRESVREESYKARWIRTLTSVGKTPILEILDEVPENEWAFWECEWIRLYRALGFQLTNATDGGEGITMTPERRLQISKAMKGVKKSPEARANMKAAHVGTRLPPQARDLSIAAIKGKKRSPEACAKQSESMKGHFVSEETCAKISAANTGKSPSESVRARISQTLQGNIPWNKGKKCPLTGVKLKGQKRSPEKRLRMKAAQQLRRAKEKGLIP